MAPPILKLSGVSLRFGARPLFRDLDLLLQANDRLCLIGRNGMGKSSLMKIIAGLVEADSGNRFLQPGIYVRYLDQAPDLGGYDTVEAALTDAARGERVAPIAGELGLDLAARLATLSGGEQRRVALAQVFLGNPDLLLLDEPTNHLDLIAIDWLERRLARFSGAFIIISHDRRLLERVTAGTLWLDRGMLRRHDKGYGDFERWADAVLAAEEAEQARLDTQLKAELHWLARGVTARRKRNQGRLRKLETMRAQRRARVAPVGSAAIDMARGDTSGKLVVEAENLGKRYGDDWVVRDFSTRIVRGDRIGIIGPNGAGKSTLLGLLTGRLTPDEGTLRLGTRLDMLFIDQARGDLDPNQRVRDVLTGGGDYVDVRGEKRHVSGYLKDFLFDPAQGQAAVSTLSGGERSRLIMARAFARPANLIILDEPTNDLDMDTLDLLQEVLADFDGTVLLVSHDRDFLDRLVTAVIVLDGSGKATEFVGGFSDWERASGGLQAKMPNTAPAPRKQPASPAKPQAPAPKPAKLSYKEQRALALLPREIAALEAEIERLGTALADPGFYARDAAAFAKASQDLESAQQRLATKEEEWLALEIKRETLAAD
ncbi:MAG: ATP-binding cassette domain-containing protein [Sphingomonadales bacterium]